MVGHVTAVITGILDVAWAIAPSTPHRNGLCPCLSVHGWKWSEIVAKSNPVSSARAASRTRSLGPMLFAGPCAPDLR